MGEAQHTVEGDWYLSCSCTDLDLGSGPGSATK